VSRRPARYDVAEYAAGVHNLRHLARCASRAATSRTPYASDEPTIHDASAIGSH
jgi:hypothetical protein